MWEFSGDIAVFCNDQFFGDLLSFLPWAAENYGYQDPQLVTVYQLTHHTAMSFISMLLIYCLVF